MSLPSSVPTCPPAVASATPTNPPSVQERAAKSAPVVSPAIAALARAEAASVQRPAPPETRPSVPAPPLPTVVAEPTTVAQSHWHDLFCDWPSSVPQRGILISKLNEASPFKAFMIRGQFLLLERTSPDSLGGRFLVIPFDEIAMVKFTDPLTQPVLEAAGFVGHLSK